MLGEIEEYTLYMENKISHVRLNGSLLQILYFKKMMGGQQISH